MSNLIKLTISRENEEWLRISYDNSNSSMAPSHLKAIDKWNENNRSKRVAFEMDTEGSFLIKYRNGGIDEVELAGRDNTLVKYWVIEIPDEETCNVFIDSFRLPSEKQRSSQDVLSVLVPMEYELTEWSDCVVPKCQETRAQLDSEVHTNKPFNQRTKGAKGAKGGWPFKKNCCKKLQQTLSKIFTRGRPTNGYYQDYYFWQRGRY
ncbi:hypothetical protein F5B19DRAFT_469511 [Rostrohypoxylon terebratum]|nr:hypothetical protein F5B19DRAFT_469511 [Rostrohypoxylon terebratum]